MWAHFSCYININDNAKKIIFCLFSSFTEVDLYFHYIYNGNQVTEFSNFLECVDVIESCLILFSF